MVLDLQAASEGAGVVGIGRADGEGAAALFRGEQERGEGFGFIGGLVEDVDLAGGERQRLVFPAVEKRPAPGIEARRFGVGGANVDFHFAGGGEGLQGARGQRREIGNEQRDDAGVGAGGGRAARGFAARLEGIFQAEFGEVLEEPLLQLGDVGPAVFFGIGHQREQVGGGFVRLGELAADVLELFGDAEGEGKGPGGGKRGK